MRAERHILEQGVTSWCSVGNVIFILYSDFQRSQIWQWSLIPQPTLSLSLTALPTSQWWSTDLHHNKQSVWTLLLHMVLPLVRIHVWFTRSRACCTSYCQYPVSQFWGAPAGFQIKRLSTAAQVQSTKWKLFLTLLQPKPHLRLVFCTYPPASPVSHPTAPYVPCRLNGCPMNDVL